MKVNVKLMGALKDSAALSGPIEVPDGATVAEILDRAGLQGSQVQIVMLNGRPCPDRRSACPADAELTVIPPVGGG